VRWKCRSLSLALATWALAGGCDGHDTSGRVFSDSSQSILLDADSSLAVLTPEQRIAVEVSVTVTRDSAGQYVYAHCLRSDDTSENDVETFALVPVQARLPVEQPVHWTHHFYNQPGKESALLWAVTDVGVLPPGWVDTGNVPPSEFDLRPGQKEAGFTFRSPHPPAPRALRYFAAGFDTIPGAAFGEPGDDDPHPSDFEEGVTGLILGPSRPYGTLGSRDNGEFLGSPWPDTLQGFSILEFGLEREALVELDVIGAAGSVVRRLAHERRGAGTYAQSWNGRSDLGATVGDGDYEFRLLVDGREVGRQEIFVFQSGAR